MRINAKQKAAEASNTTKVPLKKTDYLKNLLGNDEDDEPDKPMNAADIPEVNLVPKPAN